MNGPCIAIDVSKGRSYARGFSGFGKPVGKAFRFRHDKEGMGMIGELSERLKNETGKDVTVIYESTGVYCLPLERYLRKNNIKSTVISPLESAKARKAMVRPTKNDRLDCDTIARVYYSKEEAREQKEESKEIIDLRNLLRIRRELIEVRADYKNKYLRELDAIWPNFDEICGYDTKIGLLVIEKFGHPDNLTEKSVKSFVKKNATQRIDASALIDKLIHYMDTCCSGVDRSSLRVEHLIRLNRQIRELNEDEKRILDQAHGIAIGIPEFKTLMTIPGIGELTAMEILAEIGTIEKFESSKGLVAYCGLDPMVSESGKVTSDHLPITKKGNKRLRTTLYLAVTNMIKQKEQNKIAKYVLSKKNGGLSYKAAIVAGENKLLRIIYKLLKTGEVYIEQ